MVTNVDHCDFGMAGLCIYGYGIWPFDDQSPITGTYFDIHQDPERSSIYPRSSVLSLDPLSVPWACWVEMLMISLRD